MLPERRGKELVEKILGMLKYDVIIVGAGPGGIFAAYELMQCRPELKVAVFEAGVYSLVDIKNAKDTTSSVKEIEPIYRKKDE